eukprot:TRINITY_DN37624_c0_g1_i1.p1 TRINITY_DN37624_c0_g1~~TRINITY_DN37624_c0_g1_i1.p1  ORF type:complete len:154 (+),score=53.02 TRINITY_DN37624_c0_g1_i1:51-512(+)
MFRAIRLAQAACQVRCFSATTTRLFPVYYSPSHEWVNIEGGGRATIGITNFAQEELGEVVYIDVPDVGEDVEAGETYGTVESVKATSLLIAPVTGKVDQVNTELQENTGLVNESPEDKAWTVKLTGVPEELPEDLMTREQYDAYLEEQSAPTN